MNDLPKTPPGLCPEAQAFWKKIVSSWVLEDSALMMLQQACEALTHVREAEAVIRKEGMTIKDRFKQVRPHPCIAVIRDCRVLLLRYLKTLGLDLEPLQDGPGRPMS